LITQTPVFGKANGEGRNYVVAGPWWYLENLVYQQVWSYITAYHEDTAQTHTAQKGRVILGQDETGQAITAAQQIRAILQYAIDQKAEFQMGEIKGFDFHFPFDEIRDISCAEAIQHILRWTPDAIVWFEYTSTIPVLHCGRRSYRSSITLPMDRMTDLKITSRHDLQVRSVVLKYESSHSENGYTWRTLTLDRFPETATGQEFKSLVLTLELDGARTHTDRQSVKTAPIDVENQAWWQDHLPALNFSALKEVKIQNVRRETGLPNELVGGAVNPWMRCTVTKETVRAQITYQDPHDNVLTRDVAVRIRATNAVTKIYERCTVDSVPTPVPAGLAKILYEAAAPLTYDGTGSYVQEEIFSPENLVAKTLTIKGGLPEWETMHAPVQEVYEEVDTGRIRLHFGPPKHLGPDDLIQLMRSNRIRVVPGSLPVRCHSDTVHIQGHVTEFPDAVPLENAHVESGHFEKLTLKGRGQLILDANTIHPGKTVVLREYKIVESGVLKSALLMSSEGY
jgi:hypothetical protein